MDRGAGAADDSDESLGAAARTLFRELSDRRLRLACAESCTGGMVSEALTDIPGSSAVLWGTVVAYSNECKSRLLGVPPELIAEHGAVSRESARAMARGVFEASGADISLAITGIAGPVGGTPEKPVGLVWFGFRMAGNGNGEAYEESEVFAGDRKAVRRAASERVMLRAAQLVRERY